jgi:hypothetical protein
MAWVKLIMPCPACKARNIDTSATSWTHARCGGTLEVSESAELRCTACDARFHFRYWWWGCPRHGDSTKSGYYQDTNATSVAASLSVSAVLASKMGRSWYLAFLDNLGNW